MNSKVVLSCRTSHEDVQLAGDIYTMADKLGLSSSLLLDSFINTALRTEAEGVHHRFNMAPENNELKQCNCLVSLRMVDIDFPRI